MLINNINRAKIFLRGNLFEKAQYTNGTGGEITLAKGTVMGRITASAKLLPFASDASDGSQNPIGVLADDYTVANGATVEVVYCDAGRVAEDLLILRKVGDTLSTAVSGLGIVRDLITRNTHIDLVSGTELTGYDNQ